MSSAASDYKFGTVVSVFDGGDGSSIVHLPLVGKAFKVDKRARAVIESVKDGRPVELNDMNSRILQQLSSMKLFEMSHSQEPRTPPISEFRPLEATLLFTESCNLGCSYCYASSVPGKFKPMDEHVMRAAVDVVCNNAELTEARLAKFRYIGGGEPTVEWDLLTKTTRYIEESCERRFLRRFIRLITNGTLLTTERVAWLAQHIQFVTLSFDILLELQASRPYAGGGATHAKLMAVVQELCSNGVKFHLRTTISEAGAGRLEEMVHFVHENTGAKSIRFEPLSAIGRSISAGVGKPTQDVFVESFKAAYRLGRRLGIDVTCKMFTNYKRRSSRFCDAEFSVAPTGIVSGCHRYSREDHDGFEQFRIGGYDGKEFQFDIERINALRQIDVHSFSDCTSCIARWNCAGGCLSARTTATGISSSGPLCNLTRELLKFSIEEKLQDAQ
jgi:uncharacterized protein